MGEHESVGPEGEPNRLCAECVREPFLRAEIQTNGQEAVCSYCGEEGTTFTIERLADAVQEAIEEHFRRTSSEPTDEEWSLMKACDRDWYREGYPVEEVIASMADIDTEPAEDIRRLLEDRHFDYEDAKMGFENPFGSDAHYAEDGASDAELHAEWAHFESNLKTEARYFSRTGESTLESTFEGIRELVGRDGNPVVVEAGPGREISALFRARVFQSESKLKSAIELPDVEVGPPPSAVAKAGRMNAMGISVFYSATDPATAIAEVRPPVGSNVLVGRFEIIRPLRLLDVEALRSVRVRGSVFDSELGRRLRRADFLAGLSRRITKPVMPDDEPFEHLATQAIADFLATKIDPPLDGIIYASVQGPQGGSNVALFHNASRVERRAMPEGTEIYSRCLSGTEDDLDAEYWVSETVPVVLAPADQKPHRSLLHAAFNFSPPEELDEREPTLRLDVACLEVMLVKGVTFLTESHRVGRIRTEKRPPPF